MRISDWSSDVCSSDLREEATRMRGRDTGKPAGSCRHSRVPRDAASRRLLGMRGGNPGTPAHARATARVPGLPLLARRVRERPSGVQGKSVSVRVDTGGGRYLTHNIKKIKH